MPTRPLPLLAVPADAPSRSRFGRWFEGGHRLDRSEGHEASHPWWQVLWLTGVDYFSTLGYQPGIALLAAGILSPLATAILLIVTLFCALPVYHQVASRSFAGQGSIAMLENLIKGWFGKLFVLALIGFAGTGFVITMTLSAADAATHAIENPFLHPYLGDHQMGITLGLLALLAAVFLKGMREAIALAVGIAVPYIVLTAITIGRAFIEVAHHPELISNWQNALHHQGSWSSLALASVIVFPKLALGLSGFETGVMVMPQVKGESSDAGAEVPLGRVRNTQKLLIAAAVLMSVLLMSSSIVTTLLIPPEAYAAGGKASGRAIAYLAHGLLGETFGTVYDLVTIAILWFAGSSALAGLLNLIPRYLPRFGMAPRWTIFDRPLILLIFGISVAVTYVFAANVEAQAGAYATGVLVLMFSSAIAVALAFWHEAWLEPGAPIARRPLVLSGYFWVVSAVFAFALVDTIWERPDGLIIASIFIAGIIVLGGISRYQRATELRVVNLAFIDHNAADLWPELVGKRVNLVPLRTSSYEARRSKEEEVRRHYAIKGPIAFIHVNLSDNRSDFNASLQLDVRRELDDYVIEIYGAVAIANTIAYVSESVDPISLILGLSRQNLMTQSFKYLIWGEGETGLLVYTILLKYWDWTTEDDIRPLIFLMSD